MWHVPPATTAPSIRPLLMVHGFMDTGASFEPLGRILAQHGWEVFAPDLRGFGDTDRAGRGGYYHFPDYVADLRAVIAALRISTPVTIVGHSMGGTVATLLAGAMPELVERLVILEGLGPPNVDPSLAPLRMRKWLEDLRKFETRPPDRPMSHDEALSRLAANHTRVPDAIIESQLPRLSREADDGLRWAFDPLHRTTSPMPYTTTMYRAFAGSVNCPVFYVTGGALGYRPDDEEERLSAFKDLARADLPDAGHMMHWTQPEALANVLAPFLDGAGVRATGPTEA